MARGMTLAWDVLWYHVRSGDLPAWVDWSRVTVCGVSVPAMTTAATFPGHEPDLMRDIIPHAFNDASPAETKDATDG